MLANVFHKSVEGSLINETKAAGFY